MAKFLRYAIATLFFAASVGCLALWWRSYTRRDVFVGPNAKPTDAGLQIELSNGKTFAAIVDDGPPAFSGWHHLSFEPLKPISELLDPNRQFYWTDRVLIFPIWYPALVFALAGVGILRFRRQFSIRSALIGLAVVAALLGIVVAL